MAIFFTLKQSYRESNIPNKYYHQHTDNTLVQWIPQSYFTSSVLGKSQSLEKWPKIKAGCIRGTWSHP